MSWEIFAEKVNYDYVKIKPRILEELSWAEEQRALAPKNIEEIKNVIVYFAVMSLDTKIKHLKHLLTPDGRKWIESGFPMFNENNVLLNRIKEEYQ